MAGRPYVLLSAAMSADGYIDDASPQRLILSGPEDLDRVDAERARSDAIMVGAQTVRSDDPRLLVRSARRRGERLASGRPASPAKVTITASGDLDPAAAFFAGDGAVKRVYAAGPVAAGLAARLGDLAEVISMPDQAGLAWVLADLAGRGTARLMIEGGARLLAAALSAGLADEFQLAVAPVFVADPAAPRLLADWPATGQRARTAGRGGEGLARSGPAAAGRMVLCGAIRSGDVAVLRYRRGPQAGT
jgi:5-amino-6-(5-phosphoribosylamino)uracil reductase